MKCNSCGGEVSENASFCPLCGARLNPDAPADGRGASVSYGKGFADASSQNPYGEASSDNASGQGLGGGAGSQSPYGGSYGGTSGASGGSGTTPNGGYNPYGGSSAGGTSNGQNPYGAPAYQPQPQPQPTSQTVYAQGCASAALSDIRATQGWFKRMMFLGLVGCVPILGWTVSGYALNWSREVPFGGRTTMPERVITGKNFEMGFYYFLLSLVFGLVSGVCAAILGWIPVLGGLAALLISLFVVVFTMLSATRMAMMQQLGEGFKIGRVWDAFKRNWSGVSGAVIGPYLLAAVASFVVTLVASVILAVAIIVPAASAYASPFELSGGIFAALGAMGAAGIAVFVVCILLCLGIEAVAQVVIFRAVAHWVGRHAQDWVSEAYQAASYGAAQ